ncbi:MAG: methyltransferase domain-containing protein [Anaerolineae bacterium]|nr:methyltransferase domain-containing protein [Gloeobacterales cyanobacterium ES-bin-313]
MVHGHLRAEVDVVNRSVLNNGIAQFYDISSGIWEEVWGEHMHHGYWEKGEDNKDRRTAQIDLIEKLLEWADVKQPTAILDAGCGIGGSSLYLAQRYGATVEGITLSPVQCARAQARAQSAGLSSTVGFQVCDALDMPFADEQFDLVWSLESGEHMSDKAEFLRQCFRVLKPGGKLIFVTWCCRDGQLDERDKRWLEAIYRIYYLPYILSIPSYEALLAEQGFEKVSSVDWSKQVSRFWSLVIDSALDPTVLWRVLLQGPTVIKGALAMQLMRRSYARGLIKFGVLQAQKPGVL